MAFPSPYSRFMVMITCAAAAEQSPACWRNLGGDLPDRCQKGLAALGDMLIQISQNHSSSILAQQRLADLPECQCLNHRNQATEDDEVVCKRNGKTYCTPPNPGDGKCPSKFTKCTQIPADYPTCSCTSLRNGATGSAERLCQHMHKGVSNGRCWSVQLGACYGRKFQCEQNPPTIAATTAVTTAEATTASTTAEATTAEATTASTTAAATIAPTTASATAQATTAATSAAATTAATTAFTTAEATTAEATIALTTAAATIVASTASTTAQATTAEATTASATAVATTATTAAATTAEATTAATTASATIAATTASTTEATPTIPAPPSEPAPAPSDADKTVVEKYGRLQVDGNRIKDESKSQDVRLRGMSLFWSQWMPQYYNENALKWLVQDWKITVIRAAMAVEHGGYLSNPGAEKARVVAVVEAAIELGIYVIIDWHDHHAHEHQSEAEAFFIEMAEEYCAYPNVIFEPFNEPEGISWAGVIKPYHERILAAIRGLDCSNLVVLGNRNWDQEVVEAASDFVTDENSAITVHFYAAAHKDSLRSKARQALDMGKPLFATEWGACWYDGNGALDWTSTDAWLALFAEYNVSDANWAIADKDESCAALKGGAACGGGWNLGRLTQSGMNVRERIRGDAYPPDTNEWDPEDAGDCPSTDGGDSDEGSGGDDSDSDCTSSLSQSCMSTRACCNSGPTAGMTCFKKNDYWASCRLDCAPGQLYDQDPPEYRTPWECYFDD